MNTFDRQYHIADSNGNYYAINEDDNLVIAKDEEPIPWFTILEANKRINNSGMSGLRTVAVSLNMW